VDGIVEFLLKYNINFGAKTLSEKMFSLFFSKIYFIFKETPIKILSLKRELKLGERIFFFLILRTFL
jgi:hypothetical protein